MAYVSPDGDAVILNFEFAYTPPDGDDVELAFGSSIQVDLGLQSAVNSLFSTTLSTDQILSQALLSAQKTLFSSSPTTEQILTMNRILSSISVLGLSFVTDCNLTLSLKDGTCVPLSPLVSGDANYILSRLNVLAGVVGACSVNTDQILSMALLAGLLSPFGSDVWIEHPRADVFLFLQDLISNIKPSANISKGLNLEFSEDMLLGSELPGLSMTDDEARSFHQDKL